MAWYKTGTVSVTNGSTSVTGSGTNFVSGAQVGEAFYGPDEDLYEITAINSATSLTIGSAYGGATASGQSYAIVPTQSLVADLASDVADLISDYQTIADEVGAGKFGDGSAASPSIKFTQDQDTGFFRDTANEIGISAGGSKIGSFTANGLEFLDNDKAIFGAGSDLEIYHDGSDSYISDVGTGDLKIQGANVRLENPSGVRYFQGSSGVSYLYNSGDIKLNTTSTGIDVTGTVTADGLTVGDGHTIGNDGSDNLEIKSSSGENLLLKTGGSVVQLYNSSDVRYFRLDSNGDISFYEDTGTTAKFFWDASAESLGIGTSSTLGILTIQQASNSTAGGLTVIEASAGNVYGALSPTGTNTISLTAGSTSTDDTTLRFLTANNGVEAEAARIDSSGNVLVGTTSDLTDAYIQGGGVGFALRSSDQLAVSRSAGTVAQFNRNTSDGDIVAFRKDGTTVGSIGATSGQAFIAGANSGIRFGINSAILPTDSDGGGSDNDKDLGALSIRFDDVYATNGTIQTSDRNEKQDIAELSDAEQRVAVAAKGLLRKFRWRDAVEEKGDEARTHFGIIAQDLQAAFAAEGLDAGDYAMFINSTWTDEETGEERSRMGVRYSELLAFIIAAI